MTVKEPRRPILPVRRDETKLDKKRPHPLAVWVLVGAIAFLAVSGLWGKDREKAPQPEPPSVTEPPQEEQTAYVTQLEHRLEEILEKINGAGAVSVFINLDGGGEKVLATDQKSVSSQETDKEQTSSQQEREETVVLSGQGSGQAPFIVEEKMPLPVGILVVAEGAKDETVRYEIYEAVRALFGLSAHRIKVVQ